MVPMMMAPDDTLNSTSIDIDAVLLQNSCNVFLDVDIPLMLDPHPIRRQNIPVLAYPEVKKDRFARKMFDQEREAWTLKMMFARILRLQQTAYWYPQT